MECEDEGVDPPHYIVAIAILITEPDDVDVCMEFEPWFLVCFETGAMQLPMPSTSM